jgi:hypothetical protein
LFLTAIGLTPGGSDTVHIYTNSTQNIQNETYITIKRKNGGGGFGRNNIGRKN